MKCYAIVAFSVTMTKAECHESKPNSNGEHQNTATPSLQTAALPKNKRQSQKIIKMAERNNRKARDYYKMATTPKRCRRCYQPPVAYDIYDYQGCANTRITSEQY